MSSLESFMKDPVFRSFATHATIVIVKMMLMSQLTSFFRLTKGVFSNLEDTRFLSTVGDKKMIRTDPTVERVRRCHLNDLENIVPFVVVGLLYSLTRPELATAALHFRVFSASRICHTISYVCTLPQPCRALSYVVGVVSTASMAYNVLSSALLL